jgi:hypothetical protein
MIDDHLTRGERNNNPGNIERNAIQWHGMAIDQSGDPRFCVFKQPEFGIRAIAKILLNYSRKFTEGSKEDIDTVREIVNRWAPPIENDTGAYVHAVASAMGVEPDATIKIDDPEVLGKLAVAIIHQENGRCQYDPATIQRAVTSALT